MSMKRWLAIALTIVILEIPAVPVDAAGTIGRNVGREAGKELEPAAIAAVVVGGIVVLAAVGTLVWFLRGHKRHTPSAAFQPMIGAILDGDKPPDNGKAYGIKCPQRAGDITLACW